MKNFLNKKLLFIKVLRIKTKSNEKIFTEIYKKQSWGGTSKSGPGSDLRETQKVREYLPKLLEKYVISSILDIPCGDFNWLKEINLDSVSYIGGDIVDDLIQNNSKLYATKNKKFIKMDIINDHLPQMDLVLCRDALFHFSYSDIFKSIKNIGKSKSKYLLSSSYLLSTTNQDIVTGGWTRLNLLNKPFNFPKPLEIIHEGDFGEEKLDKSLLLWKISDL